jgi:hypothetical protein
VRLHSHSQSLASVPRAYDCAVVYLRGPLVARLHSIRAEPPGLGVWMRRCRGWDGSPLANSLGATHPAARVSEICPRLRAGSAVRLLYRPRWRFSSGFVHFGLFRAPSGLLRVEDAEFRADASPWLSIGGSLLSGRSMCGSCALSLGTGCGELAARRLIGRRAFRRAAFVWFAGVLCPSFHGCSASALLRLEREQHLRRVRSVCAVAVSSDGRCRSVGCVSNAGRGERCRRGGLVLFGGWGLCVWQSLPRRGLPG